MKKKEQLEEALKNYQNKPKKLANELGDFLVDNMDSKQISKVLRILNDTFLHIDGNDKIELPGDFDVLGALDDFKI